jgi:hypothetical protein
MRRHFERGTAVFDCEVCKRKARNTSDQYQRRVCSQCNEIGEIENGISDNDLTGEDLAQAEKCIAELRAELRDIDARTQKQTAKSIR